MGNVDELSSPSSRQALQHGVSGLQRLLFSQDKSSRLGDRQAVTYALLPVLVKSALVLGEPYRKELSTATWMGCRYTFSRKFAKYALLAHVNIVQASIFHAALQPSTQFQTCTHIS